MESLLELESDLRGASEAPLPNSPVPPLQLADAGAPNAAPPLPEVSAKESGTGVLPVIPVAPQLPAVSAPQAPTPASPVPDLPKVAQALESLVAPLALGVHPPNNSRTGL